MGKSPVLDNEKLRSISERNLSRLAEAILACTMNLYSNNAYEMLWKELTACFGKAPVSIKNSDEFFSRKLTEALRELGGDSFVNNVRLLVGMRLTGQFSSSMYRRSYRTHDFGYYAARIVNEICCYLRNCSYKQTVEELMDYEHEYIDYYESALALEIYKGNQTVIDTIKEMILGDSNTAVLTRKVIQAIIISGNRELLDLLKQLLIAARMQEGLRQAVLESADEGSLDTFKDIYKFCLDEDMFRYSSAARALFTWTGLNFEEVRIPVVRNIARTGFECLTDKNRQAECFDSPNALEVYLSIWSQGCEDVAKTDRIVENLLTDQKKYRRLLGWYFVGHVENAGYRHQLAISHLDERDEETLAYITANIYSNSKAVNAYSINIKNWAVKPLPDINLPKTHEERISLFNKLKGLAFYIGNKNKEFRESLFSFNTVRLSSEKVINCMLSLAAYDLDEEMIRELFSMMDIFTADQRRAFFIRLLDPNRREEHRRFLYEGLKDKSEYTRELSVEKLGTCRTAADDIRQICGVLAAKSARVRKQAISYLSGQTENMKQLAVTELCNGTESQIQAAIELMTEDKHLAEKNSRIIETLRAMELSTQTEIMLDKLQNASGPEGHFTYENGYGLFDIDIIRKKADSYRLDRSLELKKAPAALFAKPIKTAYKHIDEGMLLSKKEILSLMPQNPEIMQLFERMDAVFEAHKDHEYEVEEFDGSRQKILFGDASYRGLMIPAEYGSAVRLRRNGELRFSMIPFHEEFAEALREYMNDDVKMMLLHYCVNGFSGQFTNLPSWCDKAAWFAPIESTFSPNFREYGYGKYRLRYWQMAEIIRLAFKEADENRIFDAAYDIYFSMHNIIGKEYLTKCYALENTKKVSHINYLIHSPTDRYIPANHNIVSFYRDVLNSLPMTDEQFGRWFRKEYAFELGTDFRVSSLSLQQYARAVDLKLITKDSISHWILHPNVNTATSLKTLSDPDRIDGGRQLFEKYPWLDEFSSMIISRMVEVEAGRGELPTGLTNKCHDIMKIEGSEYFCKLLSTLGKDNFFRGYEYSRGTTKQEVLSQLLKKCRPGPDDTAQKLKKLLENTDISDKRLVEAAMYAPQWAGLAEDVTGWDGLRKAVWFFHAHISEHFSAEKETEVAIYSPISPRTIQRRSLRSGLVCGYLRQAWGKQVQSAV